jgi:hypothetical protein
LLQFKMSDDIPFMQPLNLQPLFAALGIQPLAPLVVPPAPAWDEGALVPEPPADPPALLPAEEQAPVAAWEEDPPLDDDASTVYGLYAAEPDHPEYTLDDIPGVLINVMEEARLFLHIARSSSVSNVIKNNVYYNMKRMVLSAWAGLTGNVQDLAICWHQDFNALLVDLESFPEPVGTVLDVHVDIVREAFMRFVDWILDNQTPHGLQDYPLLLDLYQHYVRRELRPPQMEGGGEVQQEEQEEQEQGGQGEWFGGEGQEAGGEFENQPIYEIDMVT